MAIDWDASLLAPNYDAFGVTARVFTSSDVYELTVIDKTVGLAADFAGVAVAVQTIVARAAVRAEELAQKNIAVGDLQGARIDYNGARLKIHSTRPVPVPTGEASGEIYLLLTDENA